MDSPDRRGALLFLAAVVAVAGVASGSTPLVMWATAVGAITAAAMAWSRLAWIGVDVTASFEPARAFAGEEIELRLRVVNGKRLPLPAVRLHVWLPHGLSARGPGASPTMRGFDRRLSMPGPSEA